MIDSTLQIKTVEIRNTVAETTFRKTTTKTANVN